MADPFIALEKRIRDDCRRTDVTCEILDGLIRDRKTKWYMPDFRADGLVDKDGGYLIFRVLDSYVSLGILYVEADDPEGFVYVQQQREAFDPSEKELSRLFVEKKPSRQEFLESKLINLSTCEISTLDALLLTNNKPPATSHAGLETPKRRREARVPAAPIARRTRQRTA